MNAETVELGRMDASAKGGQASATGERSTSHPVAPVPQSAAPAPRAISFEPAKIDNFSFGIGTTGIAPSQRIAVVPPAGGASAVREEKIANSGLTAPKAERPLFASGDNVSALSFSTNHVMPAEKEESARIAVAAPAGGASAVREERTMNREQVTLSHSVETESVAGRQEIPNAQRPLSTPAQRASAPANRYRITPTGHRDEAASDDTPSPHVVDLRN